MSGYIGTQPVPQATQKRQAFTATNGQTSFATSGYSVGFVDVYMNGVKLAAADYTATNGSDVVLSSGALVNDIVEIVAFTSFVASGGLPATGGTVTGDITFNDSIKSKFGTGADLQVFHNGTDAKINNDTGHLDLSNTTAGSSIRILGSGESLAEFSDDGDVDLFFNGALKLSTTNTGVTVAGVLAATTLTGNGAGITGLSAGGEQTFTATGAITAGRPVGLNSNGTISSLISPFGPAGSQSPAFAAEYNNIDYNSSNNTVTGFVSDTSGGSGGYLLQVASIDASLNITSGTAVRVPGSDRGVNTAQNQNARDLSTGKYLCIFQETNPGSNLRAAVATVSGTSVSFGGEQQLGSSSEGQSYELVYSGTANKFISFYISSSNYIYARIYTVSGSSVSVSGQITVVSSNTGRFDVRLDPSTSKIILAYSDNNDSGKLKSKICFLNGSTVSSGSVVTVDSGTLTSSQQIYLTEDTNANKIVVSYVRNSPQLNYIAIGTVNAGNNTITYGTPKTGAEGASATAVPFFVSTDNTIGLYSSQNNNLCPIKISGTSFNYGDKIASFGAVIVYVSGRSGFHSGGTLPQIKKPVFPKYVGLAAENISNGASGKVTIIGGINTAQSNLIAGLPYGMPFLSEYSTTLTLTNSLVNKVGNAMSSSAIYVKAGEI